MLNEFEEFRAYTIPVKYEVSRKGDTGFLGRFTFDSLLNFEGMGRIFTILARGYMFRTQEPDLDRARNALCAWCSIPKNKTATPRRSGRAKRTFGSCMMRSRSWWIGMAEAGSAAMFMA